MLTQFRFLFISAVLSLTIPLGLQANPPIKDEWSGYFESVPLLDCGDYWIMSNELVELSWIYFFDRHGNFIREIFMIDVVDDLYRDGKPIHVPGYANVIVQAHYEDGEWLWEQRPRSVLQGKCAWLRGPDGSGGTSNERRRRIFLRDPTF